MSKVIDTFHVEKYTVLILDEMPRTDYHKFRIDGKEFEPVPVYDAPRCIAIMSDEQFLGKTVEFI